MRRYDATADIYDERYATEQRAKYQKALESVNVADAAVLDVGCGSGLFFNEATCTAELMVGVDISRSLLLKAKLQSKSFANVFLVQADADYLPFKDGFFNFVFAFTVIQNLPKPAVTLEEFGRVTKRDGRVVVTGLKKAFGLHKFMDLLETSGMEIVSVIDEEAINCFVAVLAA